MKRIGLSGKKQRLGKHQYSHINTYIHMSTHRQTNKAALINTFSLPSTGFMVMANIEPFTHTHFHKYKCRFCVFFPLVQGKTFDIFLCFRLQLGLCGSFVAWRCSVSGFVCSSRCGLACRLSTHMHLYTKSVDTHTQAPSFLLCVL